MIHSGNSAFGFNGQIPSNFGNGGGNSGAVISPAPKLGLSAYQTPDVPVEPPEGQGVPTWNTRSVPKTI